MEVTEAEAVVVGGMVMDIHAIPSVRVHPGTSTPGKVHYVFGGVARNIADCMAKLGTPPPFLISVVGRDITGNILLEHCRASNLSTEGIRCCENARTGIVCNVFDDTGELSAAVSSLDAVERFLTPEWIVKFDRKILSAPILMLDANLSPASLSMASGMAARASVPVWFEPVSVSKSKRITSIEKVSFTSPNVDELVTMAAAVSGDEPIRTVDLQQNHSVKSLFIVVRPAIVSLLERGVGVLMVTLGARGVLLCSCTNPFVGSARFAGRRLFELVSAGCPPSVFAGRGVWPLVVHFPALAASTVTLTGAGDCFAAAAMASLCAGLDLFQSVAVGVAVSRASIETDGNVPTSFDVARLADDACRVHSSATLLHLPSAY